MANRKASTPYPEMKFFLENQGDTLSAQQDFLSEGTVIAPFSVTIQQRTIIIDFQDHVLDIMAIAVNNRTRERNYFKLYSTLLEQKISDEEFDKIIDENPDTYVQESYRDFSPLEIEVAKRASEKIMDVEDVSDLATLFSISNKSIQKCLAAANE